MRLRVLDLNISWLLWLTVFYQRVYGKPFLECCLWRSNSWGSWINIWKWEKIPMEQPQTAEYASLDDPLLNPAKRKE